MQEGGGGEGEGMGRRNRSLSLKHEFHSGQLLSFQAITFHKYLITASLLPDSRALKTRSLAPTRVTSLRHTVTHLISDIIIRGCTWRHSCSVLLQLLGSPASPVDLLKM